MVAAEPHRLRSTPGLYILDEAQTKSILECEKGDFAGFNYFTISKKVAMLDLVFGWNPPSRVESPAEMIPRINQTICTPPRNFIPLHCSPVDCHGRNVEQSHHPVHFDYTSSLFLSSPIVCAVVVVTTEGQPWSGLLYSLEGAPYDTARIDRPASVSGSTAQIIRKHSIAFSSIPGEFAGG
jgi:hypothetical protein